MQDWGWMVFPLLTCGVWSLHSSWKHASEPYRTGRLLKEQTWSSFATSHDSQTQAISESDQWFGQFWFFLKLTFFSCRQQALLYVLEDNETVIKMIIQRRSPTMRHVSRTHRVALDWLFDRINLDPKIEIKYIDTKNQLADILTKGNFTRDEWNHLLCLFNIIQFNSKDCSEVMSKRTQKDSSEKRVTAKSKPMMNLVARCSERTPGVLPSIASESPGKTRHESQFLLSSQTEQHHRTKRSVEDAYSSSYSERNGDQTWSSQEWKSDELMEDRTGRPVVFAQHTERFIVENDNMDYTPKQNQKYR